MHISPQIKDCNKPIAYNTQYITWSKAMEEVFGDKNFSKVVHMPRTSAPWLLEKQHATEQDIRRLGVWGTQLGFLCRFFFHSFF
jgi:hypothetical protein